MPRFIALDTETTGLDLYHRARPFLVTTCDPEGNQAYWEWDVDPLTRKPRVPPEDVREIRALLDSAEEVVCHNGKFDATALETIGVEFPWHKAQDTLLASHLLSSNTPHDLTSLGVVYLDRSIKDYERKLETVVQRCRRYCRTNLPDWEIASADTPGLPSATSSAWRCDYWLPRALAIHDPDREDRGELLAVLEEYANADSALTAELWPVFRESMQKQDLWDIYRHRMKLLPIARGMERNGLSVSVAEYRRLRNRYEERSEYTEKVCVGIAETMGYELTLPRSGRNASLHRFVFDTLQAPPLKLSEKTLEPSLDQETRERLETYYPPASKQNLFFTRLNEKTACDKALAALETYARYWKGLPGDPDWAVLHPWTNPTGTDTLRWSFSNPNQANISKREGYNLRYVFGPRPGRVWYSGDAQNIELRIPTFEALERDLMDVFLRPKDPPYYGSYHLVVFDVLHPEKFEQHGAEAKTVFESTWYQWVKNGNFCVPMGTRALTRKGWKGYDEVSVGDDVASWVDGKLRWTKVLDKYKFEKARLWEMRNKHFSAVTTAGHRWLGTRRTGRRCARREVTEFFTTEGMTSEHAITLSAPMEDTGTAGLTPSEAAVIALVYCDGGIECSPPRETSSQAGGRKVRFRARIYQSKPRGVEYIDATLTAWGGRYHRRVRTSGIVDWELNPTDARTLWEKAGLDRVAKTTPQDFEGLVIRLGSEARREFLRAVHVAEGHTDKAGTKLYSQNEGPFADAIRLAIFLCGNFVTEHPKGDYYGSGKTCLEMRACKPRVTGQRMKKTIVGRGDVWCLRTETGTWVMRQGSTICLTGNSVIYGAQEAKADATYRVRGAYRKIRDRFPNIAKLNDKMITHARKHGYVETIPDRDVHPRRGYPLLCSRSETGAVVPTTPLNYHVSGTAMQWMCKAMVRCQGLLDSWRDSDGFDGWIAAQVHDELLFDFPAAGEADGSNVGRIRELKSLMERGGDDIGVPTPVSFERHATTWAEGEKLKL